MAVAERKKWGFPVSSYFVSQEMPGARPLLSLLEQKSPVDRSVVRNLGRLIGKLHDEGFSARALTAASFVVGPDSVVVLTDLDRLSFGDRVSEAMAAADLAHLAGSFGESPVVGPSEKIVFLRAYCRARGLRQVPR